MIKTVVIKNIKQVLSLFKNDYYDNDIKRYRSRSLYRGLSSDKFSLKTSLERNCKTKQRYVEKSILRNFTKYAVILDSELEKSIWKQMIVGQHHGLPTRLMDWTYSPLVGLHFAVGGENLESMGDNDCVLWKIDIDEINMMLPGKYKHVLHNERAFLFTVDMLQQCVTCIDDYDHDMEENSFVLIEPPSIDQRIVNQYSYFSIIPAGITDIEDFLNRKTNNTIKYIISKDLRWQLRDLLDQMNINERIMYPGLDGLSTWLKRHYFVQ